jgi:O-methyltransferase
MVFNLKSIYLGFNLKFGKKVFVLSYLPFSLIINNINKILKERPCLLSFQEMSNLANLVSSTRMLSGDIAEVGVYSGASAKLISLLKSNSRQLYLFDTFEGLPPADEQDSTTNLSQGLYECSQESVKSYIDDDSVIIHKGIFPTDTARYIMGKEFSLVHLDMDRYRYTREALEFFAPRMVGGGIILCHDYPSLQGIKQAVDEFCAKTRWACIQLSGIQAIIIARRGAR